MKKGRFIVIDGIDGSGKSSQVKLLRKKLGRRAVFTFDPGGTPTGQTIRRLVLGTRKLSPLATLCLFLTSRAALVEEVIAPALARGRTVICDRFDSSTYAYQVHAGKHPEYAKFVRSFMGEALNAAPDAYLVLDSDPRLARRRLLGDPKKQLNTYDLKPLSYYRRVRDGFRKFKPQSSRVYFINADRSIEEVHQDVWAIVSRILQ